MKTGNGPLADEGDCKDAVGTGNLSAKMTIKIEIQQSLPIMSRKVRGIKKLCNLKLNKNRKEKEKTEMRTLESNLIAERRRNIKILLKALQKNQVLKKQKNPLNSRQIFKAKQR